MGKWTEYTKKEALKDNDELMILDTDGKANKRTLMNKVWDYVVDKMTTAVIAKLDTTDKTIIGALNEVNSKQLVNVKSVSIESGKIPDGLDYVKAAQYIVDNLLPYDVFARTFYFVSFTQNASFTMIVQKTDNGNGYASIILFGYSIRSIVYKTKVSGVWIS